MSIPYQTASEVAVPEASVPLWSDLSQLPAPTTKIPPYHGVAISLPLARLASVFSKNSMFSYYSQPVSRESQGPVWREENGAG